MPPFYTILIFSQEWRGIFHFLPLRSFPKFAIFHLIMRNHLFSHFLCAILCLTLLSTTGCIRRRMTIDSVPRGAMVYVDGKQIGRTPISTDFTYYGTRNIRLELDHYQTLHIRQPVRPPWYQYGGVDFFADNFSPNEVKDQHTWTYTLLPQTVASRDQVLSRADQLRKDGSRLVDSRGNAGPPLAREFHPRMRENGLPVEPTIAPPPEPSAPRAEMDSILMEEPSAVPPPETLPAGVPDGITPLPAPPREDFPPPGPSFPYGSETWDGPPR